MESITSPKYKIINNNELYIVKQDNDTIISDNIKIINDYFKQYPNIKCIYGDMIINYDEHLLYKHIPSFEINFLSSKDWKPVLFFHTIKLDIPNETSYDLTEITKSILKQTFVHHLPIPLSIKKHE